MNESQQQQMEAILNSLNYDFSQFSLAHFINHLQQISQKTFRFIPTSLMSHDTFGAWLTSATHEVILYEITAPALHQMHIILHELAHFMCQHPTLTLTPNKLDKLLNAQTGENTLPDLRFAARRARYSDDLHRIYEDEAEILSDLIQTEVAAYSRLRELQTAPANVVSYFNQLGLGV